MILEMNTNQVHPLKRIHKILKIKLYLNISQNIIKTSLLLYKAIVFLITILIIVLVKNI